jgi:IS30 family transposase
MTDIDWIRASFEDIKHKRDVLSQLEKQLRKVVVEKMRETKENEQIAELSYILARLADEPGE